MSQAALLGGTPVRATPFADRRTMGDAERAAVLEVLDSDLLSGFVGAPGPLALGGPRVRQLERDWGERYGFPQVVSVNSLTSGLICAMGALGIEAGDEVICSPYTMSASASCALFYGGVPIFADIDPDSFCLDPRSVAARISPRTKAIIVVHLFGRPADMDALLALARSRGIALVEDAAQAPGARINGQPVGALGDIGGFSLNCHKHIHCGEGGLMVSRDPRLAERMRLIRNHGENLTDSLPVQELPNLVGQNYRLSELHAAVAGAQLPRLDAYLAHRNRLAAYLAPRIRQLPGLRVPEVPANLYHAYYVFPMLFDAQTAGLSRDLFTQAVLAELPAARGIGQTPLTQGYVRPLYLAPLYQQRIALGSKGWPFTHRPDADYQYPPGLCPVTERLHQRELLLTPLVREPLSTDDLDDLLRAMAKVLEQAPQLRQAFPDTGH